MTSNKEIKFVFLLRKPVALLVMWDYLVGSYLHNSGQSRE